MEQLRAEEISSIIKKQIKDFDTKLEVNETGTIISIGDGVARVHGLDKCMAGEMIELPGNVYGVALNLEEGNVGVAIFGRDTGVKEGDTVKRTGKILQVPVGEELAGRVVNALGIPVDGKGPITSKESRVVERESS